MSKWKDWKKYAGIAIGLGPLAYFMPTYYALNGKRIYQNYSGHFDRQKERLDESQKKQDAFYVQEEKKATLEQRRDAIDRQRDRIGVGSKYRTSTRNENIRGDQRKEPLG